MVSVRSGWTPSEVLVWLFLVFLDLLFQMISDIVSRRCDLADKWSFVIQFGGLCCLGDLLVIVLGRLGGDVDRLCVLSCTRI